MWHATRVMKTENAYIAASVNRFSKCAAISPNSRIIAFGSHKLIAIWRVGVSDLFSQKFYFKNTQKYLSRTEQKLQSLRLYTPMML